MWAGALFKKEMIEREKERRMGVVRGETGGERRKEKPGGGEGEAFEKLKSKAPSDGVGQGKRVTGRSNW